MIGRRNIPSVVALVMLVVVLPATAAAQVTTASVTGTVKDAQGGVIPGAAGTLSSDTRGTHLPDVFTNASGDFTFANVPADRYTVQVTMQGFKTLKRPGIVVNAVDRTLVGSLTIEVGGLTDTVQVSAASPIVQ